MTAEAEIFDRDERAAGATRPWYREPLVLLVIALPVATVVAGLSTLLIAERGADSIVAGEFRKDGLAINQDSTRDRAAARLGVSALLHLDGTTLRAEVTAAAAALPAQLVVVLSHATRADLDRRLTLTATGVGRYAGALPRLAPGHWYLELAPPDRRWRLTADFADAPTTLRLRPAPTP